MRLPPLTFVIGGAASGKSAFAEGLLVASGLPKTYVATAQAFDTEMAEKIAQHRAARDGRDWTTVEAPLDLLRPLSGVEAGQAVLIDCMTLWLSNQILADADWQAELTQVLEEMRAAPAPLVVVSNEVGAGIVPETKLGRDFRNAQGRLNQLVAAEADCVVQVTVGIPQVLKGTLPI